MQQSENRPTRCAEAEMGEHRQCLIGLLVALAHANSVKRGCGDVFGRLAGPLGPPLPGPSDARGPSPRRPPALRCRASPGGAPMPAAQFAQFLATFDIASHRQALDFVDAVFANGAGVLRHAFAHGIRQRFTHPQLRQLLASITPEQMLAPHELSGLRIPTLLVWGREERVLPRTHFEFFRKHLPSHAEIEEWPNFGHIGFLEQPDALAARILGFARATAAGAKNLSRRSTGCGDYATLRVSA